MTSARETAAGLAIRGRDRAMLPPAGLQAVMQTHLAEQGGGRAVVRDAFTALRNALAARMLRRALADVASTSAEDYRDFGLDKAEMLAALERLRAAIERDGTPAATRGGRNGGSPSLAILVTRREPRLPVGLEQSPAL